MSATTAAVLGGTPDPRISRAEFPPSRTAPTFYCSVCFERHPLASEGVVRLTNCGHYLCRESFEGFLLGRITERRTTLHCFALTHQLAPLVSGELATPGASVGGGGSSPGTPGTPSPPPAPWACGACTFLNADAYRPECEICMTRRPRGSVPPRPAAAAELLRRARARLRARAAASRRECHAVIDPANVRAALAGAPDALVRYERALALTAPDAVECPNKACGLVQKGSPARPAMVCAGCGAAFCFSHGGAHPGATCAAFDRAHAAEEKATAAQLARDGVLPCPGCRAPTYKTEGCNHMTCANKTCSTQWCWTCGSEIPGGGVTEHFEGGLCQQFGGDVVNRSLLRRGAGGAVVLLWAVLPKCCGCCGGENDGGAERVAEMLRDLYQPNDEWGCGVTRRCGRKTRLALNFFCACAPRCVYVGGGGEVRLSVSLQFRPHLLPFQRPPPPPHTHTSRAQGASLSPSSRSPLRLARPPSCTRSICVRCRWRSCAACGCAWEFFLGGAGLTGAPFFL